MTDTDRRTEPALTAEEWKDYQGPATGLFGKRYASEAEHHIAIAALDGGMSRHALAALCLHAQPFGFSRTDVNAARERARQLRAEALHVASVAYNDPSRCGQIEWAAKWWDEFADRIAALLPPESH